MYLKKINLLFFDPNQELKHHFLYFKNFFFKSESGQLKGLSFVHLLIVPMKNVTSYGVTALLLKNLFVHLLTRIAIWNVSFQFCLTLETCFSNFILKNLMNSHLRIFWLYQEEKLPQMVQAHSFWIKLFAPSRSILRYIWLPSINVFFMIIVRKLRKYLPPMLHMFSFFFDRRKRHKII